MPVAALDTVKTYRKNHALKNASICKRWMPDMQEATPFSLTEHRRFLRLVGGAAQ